MSELPSAGRSGQRLGQIMLEELKGRHIIGTVALFEPASENEAKDA